MAHYARLNSNNIVEQVVVISNDNEATEAEGIAFCEALFNGGNWKKTSYNATIRKNFASVGYLYDSRRDAFIPPKPFPSWTLNETICQWSAPVAYPNDGKIYAWDEISKEWYEIANPFA
jgi:hypothetical protein